MKMCEQIFWQFKMSHVKQSKVSFRQQKLQNMVAIQMEQNCWIGGTRSELWRPGQQPWFHHETKYLALGFCCWELNFLANPFCMVTIQEQSKINEFLQYWWQTSTLLSLLPSVMELPSILADSGVWWQGVGQISCMWRVWRGHTAQRCSSTFLIKVVRSPLTAVWIQRAVFSGRRHSVTSLQMFVFY